MKLIFLWHLENLSPKSLAGEVLALQKNLGLPGLHRECQELLSELGLGPIKSYTKAQWKREVSRLLEEKNRMMILQQTKSYKKLSFQQLSKEEYEIKPYIGNLPLNKIRTMIRLRAQVFKSATFNFQSDVLFSKENWLCECGRIMSQTHQKGCIQYADLRLLHNLGEDSGLVDYFDTILRRQEGKQSNQLQWRGNFTFAALWLRDRSVYEEWFF